MYLAIIALLIAQSAVEAPLVGRPSEGFYNAVGEKVRIEMAVDRNEVEVEQPLILTLKILGADNPASIQRPDLRKIADFDSGFHIDDIPETPIESARAFQYRLRAKDAR